MPNYLYNGVELPALPEWDKTVYPYAVIVETLLLGTPAMWELYLTTTPLGAHDGESGVLGSTGDYLKATADGHGLKYMIDLSQDHTDWTDKSDIELTSGADVVSIGGDFMTTGALLWCNYDVFNYEQDTIYLAASYPIDAETGVEIHDYEIGGEPEPETKPLYYSKGGVWRRLFRRVNGAWEEVDGVFGLTPEVRELKELHDSLGVVEPFIYFTDPPPL